MTSRRRINRRPVLFRLARVDVGAPAGGSDNVRGQTLAMSCVRACVCARGASRVRRRWAAARWRWRRAGGGWVDGWVDGGGERSGGGSGGEVGVVDGCGSVGDDSPW